MPISLHRVSLLFARKVKKRIIPILISLRKSRKLKSFKFLWHSNKLPKGSFISRPKKYYYKPYHQFDSASSTPLISFIPRRKLGDRVCLSRQQQILSMLFLCSCFGGSEGSRRKPEGMLLSEALCLPTTMEEEEDEEEEEDSVDKRAERFIQRFYAEMRLQRQESF